MGGRVHRAGLVGDQMSSQWGRNEEVRMRREGGGIERRFSAVAMPMYALHYAHPADNFRHFRQIITDQSSLHLLDI